MYINIESLSDDAIIHLLPTSSSTKPIFRKRVRKEHIEISYDYYVGIEKVRIAKKIDICSDEEIKKEKEKFFETIDKYNKITDVIICKKKDLRKDIIDKFRYCEPVIEYEEQPIQIDPYILGLWLGDGHSRLSSLTSIDKIIIDRWYKYAEELGLSVKKTYRKDRESNIKKGETERLYSYDINSGTKFGKKDRNIFLKYLTDYNLIKNKHIPDCYLKNNKDVRLQVLAGIIDTDGYYDKGVYEVIQKSKKLSLDICTLATSLGFYTQITKCKKICTNSKTKAWNYYYRIYISINQNSPIIPVILERKKAQTVKNYYNPKIALCEDDIPKQIEWNEEKELFMMSVIKKFLVENPKSKSIPWVKLVKACSKFGNISSDALRAKYREIKDKYPLDDVKIYKDDLTTESDDWMDKITVILDKIELNKPLDKKEKNWVAGQKSRKTHSLEQEKLLSKIPIFNMTMFEMKWWENYDDILFDLENNIPLDKKQKCWIYRQKKLTDPKRKEAFNKLYSLYDE
jgi:hypothetical protein